MKKKILITGVSGFIGSFYKEYIQPKYDYIGVSRFVSKNTITYKNLNTNVFNSAYACIHLAGKAHDLKQKVNESEYYKINTNLTIKIFNQFLNSNCKVFIYMSSIKAVADIANTSLTEDSIPNPITVYGKSKLKAEQYILAQKLTNSKRVYILRPCMIHGPNNKGNLNLLYNLVSKNIPYPLGSYKNKRSYLYVENLSFIMNHLISNESISTGIYNVSDSTISSIELINLISSFTNKRIPILNIPKTIIHLIARIGDYLPIIINSERLNKITENYIVSNSKIKQAINTPLPIQTELGFKKTIQSLSKK